MADDVISIARVPAPHIVRVTQYEDPHNAFALFHRETVMGEAPEGFESFIVAATVPVETGQGVRPLSVQGPVTGAATLVDALAGAPAAIEAAANHQLDSMRKQQLDRPRILRPGEVPGVQRRG